jgi:hypothetical protein
MLRIIRGVKNCATPFESCLFAARHDESSASAKKNGTIPDQGGIHFPHFLELSRHRRKTAIN